MEPKPDRKWNTTHYHFEEWVLPANLKLVRIKSDQSGYIQHRLEETFLKGLCLEADIAELTFTMILKLKGEIK